MKSFHELTPIGQARRLRPMAREALAGFGIQPTRLSQLTAATNTIFRVDTAGGDRVVLRIASPQSAHSEGETVSEISWMHAVDQDTDIRIAAPVSTRDGRWVTHHRLDGVPEARLCSVFRWVPGAMLADRLTETNVARHGELAARLHLHGRSYRPPSDFRIRAYDNVFAYSDPGFPVSEPIRLFDTGSDARLSESQRRLFRRITDHIQGAIDRLHASETRPQVIHNDLHVWNVKIHRDQAIALDFEDLLWGYPVQDIATSLYYYRFREDGATLCAAYRSGYERVAPWPEEKEGQIETLIIGRALLLANFVVASPNAEDRAFAPIYVERTETRLRAYASAHL